MGFQRICSTVCLILGLTALVRAEVPYVTCGSSVKLVLDTLGVKMLGNEVTYGGQGSGNLVITSIMEGESSSKMAYWIVSGTTAEPCAQGDRIKNGQTIRLYQPSLKLWLTSTSHKSPLSSNSEVSGIRVDNPEDLTDKSEWKVVLDSGSEWKLSSKVSFQNAFSGLWLMTHNMQYGRPLAHHLEVIAHPNKSANTTWRALQGVFFQGVTDLSFRGNKSGEVVELTDDMETQHWEL